MKLKKFIGCYFYVSFTKHTLLTYLQKKNEKHTVNSGAMNIPSMYVCDLQFQFPTERSENVFGKC